MQEPPTFNSLVARWREARGHGSEQEKEALGGIVQAVDASPSLRSKRDLIMDFVDTMSASDVGSDWSDFVARRREAELDDLIAEEKLKPEETRDFVATAFRTGEVPSGGTAVTRILPPVSRFSAGGEHGSKKQRVLDRLTTFLDRYLGLG